MKDLLNRIQLRHLRLIHSVNEVGQLSIAADRLAITQPAASRMLAEIETMVGKPLFVRNPKGMIATPIGEVLARHATSLLQGLAATVNEVGAFATGKKGSVRVGSVTGAAVAYVVPAIQSLMLGSGGADVHIEVGPSDVLMAGLVNGDYDFILSRVSPENDPRMFDIQHGRVETVEFLIRAEHPLAKINAPSITDLAGYNWVAQAPGTPMRQAVEETFFANGVALPDEIINTPSLLVMIAYVQNSDSISPISSEVADLLVSSKVGGIRSIKIRKSIIISPYHLIQLKNVQSSPIAAQLRARVIAALSANAL
ncbi:LysR substrate-binding domain-containing protein [Falsihalocynthiibacter arcticus]|uniref:LysR substrate-binding domain-containing protein n=1 Tax=Falsihalocynthiibacter arcticus TaxID=1579316 RepID=UPI0030026EB5